MKEAYSMPVLAPSQLGVGIAARDSMLIHGVRLIAEKLGPRAVIEHTDLRNAHLRDGAARFNAGDGYLVGLPEQVWPALHAFRTSIKASVGLEVRFDKMHAYNEGREATAFCMTLTAAEAATSSEDTLARALGWLFLPTRLKGAGIRRLATVHDGAFIGCMNDILPRFITRNSDTNTPTTPSFFDPQLESVLGWGSFNATSSARQYDHFLNDARPGPAGYAAAVCDAWGRLHAVTLGHLKEANSRVMEREAEAASGSQKELTVFVDHANTSRLQNVVATLPVTCRERILLG
eukprot:jgi/Tetstr1/458512/TSEL_044918.t1